MQTFTKILNKAWQGALCAGICLVIAAGPSARAQQITAQTLVDRAQIQDLITRYYYNFGKENAKSFPDFYADDAELILGTTHFKGKDGIAKAYAPHGDSPMPKPIPSTSRSAIR